MGIQTKHWKYTNTVNTINQCLVLTLCNLCFITAQSTEDLGLLQKNKQITVSSSQTIQQVGLMVPIGANYADYELSMTGIKTLTDRILAIPAIANTSKYFATFSGPLDTLVNSQVMIKTTLQNIIKHKTDKPAPTLLPSCMTLWRDYSPNELKELLAKITVFASKLDYAATIAKYDADTELYFTAHSAVEQIRESLEDFEGLLVDRATLIDSLMNKKVLSEIVSGIESSSFDHNIDGSPQCVTPGKFETLKILTCDTNKEGILCIVEIKTVSTPQTYTLYSPVIYKDFRLTTYTDNDYIAKNTLNKWTILQCTEDQDETLDVFDICDALPYENECGQAFDSKDFNLYYKNCNFSRTHTVKDIDTDEGYLVQESYDTVQLVNSDKSGTPKILNSKQPYLIKTGKTVQLIKGKVTLEVKPKYTTTEEKVITTWLTESEINSMERTVETEEILENIDYGLYVDIILVVVMTMIVPSVGFLMKMYLKHGPKRKHDYEHKTKTKQNLADNHKLTHLLR
jgi:hypothetical protein